MFTIEIEFLTGRYAATAHFDRNQHEWPPHPARLFSAMVATWADADEPDLTERAALEWLEAQPPPAIAASDASPRRPVTHYVPVNNTAVISTSWYRRRAERINEIDDQLDAALEASRGKVDKKVARLQERLASAQEVSNQVESVGNTNPGTAAALLPDHRVRQERVFPSVAPAEPRVTFLWDSVPDPNTAKTIDGLLERVTRLGHSSSLVSCRVGDQHPEPDFVPGDGELTLRCVRAGQLEALEREYANHRASRPRSLPFVGVKYQTDQSPLVVETPVSSNLVGEWLVFAFEPQSRWFPSTRSVEVAEALRDAVFHHAEDPLPEGLSGHRDDGAPSQSPHVAFIPLPYVGSEHADGRLMGAAVMIPAESDARTRRSVLRAIGNWENATDSLRLTLGRAGVVHMGRTTSHSLATLSHRIWEGPASVWATATPIALPTHPGALSKGGARARSRAWEKAKQAVIASCDHVGLPEPIDVSLSLNPFLAGARPAPRYPAFRQRGRDGASVARRLVHAVVEFDCAVRGPLLLGAGRYFGLGLMRPLEQGQST